MNLTLRGSLPAFELMITAPDVRSPYSAEGIPLITSTLSTLSKDTFLRSIPPLILATPEGSVVAPLAVDDSLCRFALLDRGEPSIIMAVPRLFMLPPDKDLIVTVFALLKLGFSMLTPGSNCITSLMVLACRWSIACLLILEAVELPAWLLLAETIISSNLKLASFILNSK